MVDADENHVLSSPLERSALNRFFVIGGPLGLFVGIVLSLWVHGQHVTHSLVVQIDPRLRAGSPQAARVLIVPEAGGPVGDVSADLTLRREGEEDAGLGVLDPVGDEGLAQANVLVPDLAPGRARLRVRARAGESVAFDEEIEVEIVAEREPARGEPVVSSSRSQYADDSEPQPATHRIVVRPDGRLLTSFDVELFVRVTDPEGVPWSGPVEVRLADGELMDMVGDPNAPVLLARGRTDELGLFAVDGPLLSEVVRIEVRLLAHDDPARVIAKRRVRLVSFSGAVKASTDPRVVAPGGTVEIQAFGLSAARPVFVDVHGPDGAWVHTFTPPMFGREPPRAIELPDLGPGVYQVEAYHFITEPGESSEIVCVEVAPGGAASELDALVKRHQEEVSTPRVESGFDLELERKWLQRVADTQVDDATRALARRVLLGTLPPRVHGPPLALMTRELHREALAAWKARWVMGLRIYMLGGGGLFLLAMTVLMLRSHGRGADATLAELAEHEEGIDREALIAHVRHARRDALLRGFGVLAIMAGAILTSVLLLEKLLWAA